MAKSVKMTKALTDTWPNLKNWPSDIGAPPTVDNINDATVLAKAGTAVHMALAMYMRKDGASDNEAAVAATAATGSKSNTHRVKRDLQIKAGTLSMKKLESRGGHYVMTVALKGQAAKTPKAPKTKTAKVAKKVTMLDISASKSKTDGSGETATE